MGVAHKTLTSLAEYETAVVPPTSWNVFVSVGAVVVVVGRVVAGGVDDVVCRTVVDVVWVGDGVGVGVLLVEVAVEVETDVLDRDVDGDGCGIDEPLRRMLVVVDPLLLASSVVATPLDLLVGSEPVGSLLPTVRSVDGVVDGDTSPRALVWELGPLVVADASAAVSLTSAGGAMPSSTVETPVQATATAAVLPTPHRTTYPTIFHMDSVSVESGLGQPNQVLNRS